MTQEEKELLLKDLCARLPYGVICKRGDYIEKLEGVHPSRVYSIYTEDEDKLNMCHHIEDIKLYLRPMSSMTEEEKKEEWELWDIVTKTRNDLHYLYTDFLISHHFDYRGLIEKGLALEAPEGMYK